MTRPGRNDPCPCGSGRKYKTCCLNADRRARRSGADGPLLTPELLERARREEVWQTELVPFAASFENDPGARPTVALVTAGELMVWADVHGRVTGDPAEVAGLLADAVVAAADRDAFLAGRKPEIVAAASLHAAGILLETPWSGWRPTLEELAELFDVSTASISNRSVEMRERVPRPRREAGRRSGRSQKPRDPDKTSLF